MSDSERKAGIARYHLPGLFEFYDFYKAFLALYFSHREYFYPWCEIGSIYGAPADSLWGGGRVGYGKNDATDVHALMQEYQISSRLTFSNSLLTAMHLSDKRCNALCDLFHSNGEIRNGIIVYSDLLLEYLKEHYPNYTFISTTTKVLTAPEEASAELVRKDYDYVVLDFRLNKAWDFLNTLSDAEKAKVEFLCNECCYFGCKDRKACYENVSRKALGEHCKDHICRSPYANEGYVFSRAMESPAFISIQDIQEIYLPLGFTEFKLEGRSLGSAMVLEFLLYYMVKPECQLKVREQIYLNHSLDLF